MPNILVADDHDLVRDTIAAYLGMVAEFEVVTASDLGGARARLLGALPIDLAILDYNMPGMNGLDGLGRVRAEFPHTRVALMSGVATADVAQEAMAKGAAGFFPKSLSADTLVNAARFVLAGETYFPFDMAISQGAADPRGTYKGLSSRETEALRGLCAGKSNKEIARELDLQEVTIKLHVKKVLAKLGVKNRTQAALRAQADGFQ